MPSTDWGPSWAKAHATHPLRVSPENRARWERYWDLVSEDYLLDVVNSSEDYGRAVDHLCSDMGVGPRSTVMDIGCGPGTFTFHLAQRVEVVRAMDTSSGMLEALTAKARQTDIRNIEVMNMDWRDYDGGRSDLVLASLSPAIDGPDALFRMESFARSACCYVTARRTDGMGLRDDLWERVMGSPLPRSAAYDVTYPLNLLLSKGRDPNLWFFDVTTRRERRVEDLKSQYIAYFSIFREIDRSMERVIEEAIDDSLERNSVTESTMTMAMLYWKVGEGCR